MTPTPRRYFGGASVQAGGPATVYQLNASTYAELVDSYIGIPAAIAMTREDFHALTDKEKNRIKDGPYICGCSFKEGATIRNDANADQLNLIILDLDEGDFVKNFYEAPEELIESLYPLNVTVWATAKSTPEKPRLKAMFDIEPCDLKHKKRFVRQLTKRIGIPKNFKGQVESITISQAQYRPVQFLGAENDAILASRTNGVALRVEDLPAKEDDDTGDVDTKKVIEPDDSEATEETETIRNRLKNRNRLIPLLLQGEWEGEKFWSQSEADFSLCCSICEQTENHDQQEDLFTDSGMYRDDRKMILAFKAARKKVAAQKAERLDGLLMLDDETEAVGTSETKAEKSKTSSTLVWGVNAFPAIVKPETVVLGNAWLRRGDIAHLISTAGAGKSVAMIQASMAWALGLAYFGIRPPGPLRILLFSGEDDQTTLGQCREGFLENSEAITGQKLMAADLESLDSMLRTEFSREHVGMGFHLHLVALVKQSPADLVIVNPLLSYIGGEIVASASEWLRKGLMPVLQKHDCAALIAHHTGKMAKDGWDNTDDTYAGIGGGEVANVPRTILVLRPTNTEGLFVLKVCKRKTTGWKDSEGNFTASHFMKQSRDPERPAWIPVGHSEALELTSAIKTAGGTGGSRRKATPAHVEEALSGGPMKRQDLIERLKTRCQCSEKPVKDAIDAAVFDELVSSFTKANPNGGHAIKWFQLSGDGEQGVA